MRVIILEAVYLIAITGAVGVLLVALFAWSPLGLKWRQDRNRRAAERASLGDGLSCERHGPIAAGDLVRLPTGETMCPRCYQETL